MTTKLFEITLSGGEHTYETRRFQPGEAVSGTVTIYPEQDINCKNVQVTLMWATRGRGTRFEQKVAVVDLYQGELRQGMPRSFDFLFNLPNEPWSYEGHYISIDWSIKAKIDVPWKRDLEAEKTFLMFPPPPDANKSRY